MEDKKGFIDICLGLQWGDEGKGKIVDYLAKDYDIVARFQGGPNAGHTLWHGNDKIVLHNLPSGILHEHVKNFIGPGCVVDPQTLLQEINSVRILLNYPLERMKELVYLSKNAFVIHPLHKLLDRAIENSKGENKVGTTGKGIGTSYAGIKNRTNFRFGDFLLKNETFIDSDFYHNFMKDLSEEIIFHDKDFAEHLNSSAIKNALLDFEFGLAQLTEFVTPVDTFWLEDQIISGKKVLAEGAQGTMLDNNFGCYPMVTSSNTIAGAAPVGLGVPMKYFRKTIGVCKWYTTKVGEGDFPSEIDSDDLAHLMREAGGEVGATTGRPRRIGWFDVPQMNYAIRLNAVDELIITKVDINPFEKVEVVSSYVVGFYEDEEHTTCMFPFDTLEIRSVIRHCLKMKWQRFDDETSMLHSDFALYLNYLKNQLDRNVKITHISVGPYRNDIEEVLF